MTAAVARGHIDTEARVGASMGWASQKPHGGYLKFFFGPYCKHMASAFNGSRQITMAPNGYLWLKMAPNSFMLGINSDCLFQMGCNSWDCNFDGCGSLYIGWFSMDGSGSSDPNGSVGSQLENCIIMGPTECERFCWHFNGSPWVFTELYGCWWVSLGIDGSWQITMAPDDSDWLPKFYDW